MNEKILIGAGLALGVSGLIFLFTRPSAAAQKQGGGGGGGQQPGAKQGGGEVTAPPAAPPPATPPPASPPPAVPPPAPPPPAAHPLLDAAVAALKGVDAMWANYQAVQTQANHDLWQQVWNDAYNAMSAALRGGELGTTGEVFNNATQALAFADGIRDNWVDAQKEVDAANAAHDAPRIEAAETNFISVSAMLDNARNDAYSKMSLAVMAQTITPDQMQKALQDAFNLGL